VLPDPRRASSTTGPVSGSTGKARSRRSTSRRTVAGSGRGSSFLKQALANSERTFAGTAALPCATDAPEHLPGTLTLLGLPPVQGVDQQVGVNQVTGGHPYPRLTPGPRRARPGHTGSLRGSGGTQLTGRPPPRSPPGPPRRPPSQDQLGLGDPQLCRPLLQRSLVLVAYVQLLPFLIYIVYIIRCSPNLGPCSEALRPASRVPWSLLRLYDSLRSGEFVFTASSPKMAGRSAPRVFDRAL
jgi:hypothetical protein